MTKSLVDLVESAYDAGRKCDRMQLDALKLETAAMAGKIAADLMEDPPDPPKLYSCQQLADTLHKMAQAYHMANPESPRWQIEHQAAEIVRQVSDLARELAVGKTMYYATMDEDEPAGFRWKTSAMEIDDISYGGKFRDRESGIWIDMRDLDPDMIFWQRDVCDGACSALNGLDAANRRSTGNENN